MPNTNSNSNTLPLGNLSPEEFLHDYWQKKPLLIRQALSITQPPISAEELAGLACEDDINARIVQEHHSKGPWHTSYGPFTENDFAALPDSHWTLLVSDCEKHLPHLRSLIGPFRFIPNWRIDDLMISYATESGSVGPHTDNYDVFLLQLEGVREWRISSTANPEDFIEGLELKILKSFHPDQTWRLKPGDMLYLPPHIAHHGLAYGGACMTASIGFKAPSWRDILQAYVEELILQTPEDDHYQDPDLQLQDNPAEVSVETAKKFRTLIQGRLASDDKFFADWLGRYLTEQNSDLLSDDELNLLSKDEFIGQLQTTQQIELDQFVRPAYSLEKAQLLFFIDGQSCKLPLELLEDIQVLCNHRDIPVALLPCWQHTDLNNLLYRLYQAQLIKLN
ncbi:MAG: cupin domain-containing protein [Thiothrix sp.]|nr:MAG: cupin domain-containing protein [Thiothrix sp.]